MVYIDHPPHTRGYCHLFGDNLDELHRFAKKNGIGKHWFHNTKGANQPHYYVHENKLYRLVRAGAIYVEWRIVPSMMKQFFEKKVNL